MSDWRVGQVQPVALAQLRPPMKAEEALPVLPFRTDQAPGPDGAADWVAAGSACLLLLVVLVWALRRWGRVGKPGAWLAQRHVTVLERASLGAPGQQLVVVRYRDRQLVLLLGPGQAACVRDDPVSPGTTADAVVSGSARRQHEPVA